MDFKEIAKHITNHLDYTSSKLFSERMLQKRHCDDFDEKMKQYNLERASLLKDLKLIQTNPLDSSVLENVYGKYKSVEGESFELSDNNIEEMLNMKPNFLFDDMPNITNKKQQAELDFCDAQIKSFTDELISNKCEYIEPPEFCLESIIKEFTLKLDLINEESEKLHKDFKFVYDIEFRNGEDTSSIGDTIVSVSDSLKKIKQFWTDKKSIMIVEENLSKSLKKADELNNKEHSAKVLDLVHKILLQLESVTYHYKLNA